MTDLIDIKNNCANTIDELFNKYINNPYMLQRINNHIVKYLPNILEIEINQHSERVIRLNNLINEQQQFIQIFLSKNQYFYLPSSNFFYEYNGKNYTIVKGDEIVYNLLSNISKSKDKLLMKWKQRTKLNILKQIKERSLFSSIPESETIQTILNVLYPSIFTKKSQAKYFLTILGDNILKKKTKLNFIITQKTKQLLIELDNISNITISNTNIINNFMTKYHENYTYETCRLIKINENFSFDLWKDLIRKIGLDLLCVATHYSNRYDNSDQFLEYDAIEEDIKSHILYLKNTNQNEIVNIFCNQCIQKSQNNTFKIEWKKLHFIWKQFLSNCSLPNIIYSNTLKTLLKDKYEYEETTDTFYNITSKYLPVVFDFINFWEETIFITDTPYTNLSTNIEELELYELCLLFKIWVKNKDDAYSSGVINEENVLKILSHFFSNIVIIEDKYVLNIKCKLWDKIKDINNSLEYIKTMFKNKHTLMLSFSDAYNYYCKFVGSNNKLIVSKIYFEKYLSVILIDFIVYDNFISNEWLFTTPLNISEQLCIL
jgi:hypothetical protein